MPLILSGNVASATAAVGYEVANSCRFERASTTKMVKTLGTPTSQTTFTISCWMKKANTVDSNQFVCGWGSTGANYGYLNTFAGENKLDVYIDDGVGGSRRTYRLFRDYSAWYHIVLDVDTTEGDNADRIKLYVNGVQQTSFDDTRTTAENYTILGLASGQLFEVGKSGLVNHFDGYLAEFCFIDGLSLTPTSFGEFDSDSPTIWKPIDVSGLTFGNNGFYLDFEDSSNLGNDANGGTDLTETNLDATDQATDTPTNNFCVMNPLDNYYAGATFAEGNCKISTSGNVTYTTATMGLSAGKWYWEVQFINATGSGGGGDNQYIGIVEKPSTGTTIQQGNSNFQNYFLAYNGEIRWTGTEITYASSYTDGDIIGVALDLTNNKIYFSKNGAWATGSGAWDSTTFDAAVGDQAVTAVTSTSTGNYFPTVSYDDTKLGHFNFNFGGCPAFTVSSSNADENGYGSFEYAVPSGYLALCTKNLGSDGG